jgi:hypothetical protein
MPCIINLPRKAGRKKKSAKIKETIGKRNDQKKKTKRRNKDRSNRGERRGTANRK